MNKLNKKTTFEFIEQMKMYIRNIAENDLDISPLPSNKDKSIVEESSTDVGSDINNSDVLMDTVDEEFIYE